MQTLSEILSETISEVKKFKFGSDYPKKLYHRIDDKVVEILQSKTQYKIIQATCLEGTSHFYVCKNDKVKIHFYTMIRLQISNKQHNPREPEYYRLNKIRIE